jgi:hypothetical protein
MPDEINGQDAKVLTEAQEVSAVRFSMSPAPMQQNEGVPFSCLNDASDEFPRAMKINLAAQ